MKTLQNLPNTWTQTKLNTKSEIADYILSDNWGLDLYMDNNRNKLMKIEQLTTKWKITSSEHQGGIFKTFKNYMVMKTQHIQLYSVQWTQF